MLKESWKEGDDPKATWEPAWELHSGGFLVRRISKERTYRWKGCITPTETQYKNEDLPDIG